jgi:hypothetical protein
MNKTEKQIAKYQLQQEQKILRELKQVYAQASKDLQKSINDLNLRTDMQNLQSIIYQVKYQEAMKKQIDGILDKLNKGSYQAINEYLQDAYQNGYIGNMYSLQKQGIPITVPIDQKKVLTALQTDSKLSSKYHSGNVLKGRLAEDVKKLKVTIRAELSRGIANGETWQQVAYKIALGMNNPMSKALNMAMRIARTEGHRVNQQGFLDAGTEAKKKGADIVKQWDATLDSVTRPWHQEADGQIREWGDFFDVGGEKMKAPSVGGSARNVCNCRCQLLQRAKWALDEDELKTLQDRASFFGLDKSKDFEDFKKKYLNLPQNADTMKVKEYDVLAHTQKLKGAMNSSDYDEYMNILTEHNNTSLQKLYAKYADKINGVQYEKDDGYYSPAENRLVFNYPLQKYIDNGRSKYHTLAHEYGHFYDAKADYAGLHFKEIETIHSNTKYQINRFAKKASSSDEFLTAVRKDRDFLKSILTTDVEKDFRNHDASCGVQDAVDGLLSHRINWGHGDKYYNRKYHSVKKLKEHKGLQTAYKELGIDASNLSKVANECRVYESASEMWANIMSAEVNGGSELEYVKKYLPNSYKIFIKILKRVK